MRKGTGSTTSCMQNIVKFTQTEGVDILVQFLIGFLQGGLCPTFAYTSLPYIRRRVLGDCMHIVDV